MDKKELEYFIKSKVVEQGLTLGKFAGMLKALPQNLSQKLKRGSVSYLDAVKMADLLGYNIEWVKRK